MKKIIMLGTMLTVGLQVAMAQGTYGKQQPFYMRWWHTVTSFFVPTKYPSKVRVEQISAKAEAIPTKCPKKSSAGSTLYECRSKKRAEAKCSDINENANEWCIGTYCAKCTGHNINTKACTICERWGVCLSK